MSERDPVKPASTRTLEAETVVRAPMEAVFDLLVDVQRYDEFSQYLESVGADGDGGPGTIYRLRFEWWRLSYTAVSRVEAIDRPQRIDWKVIKDIDATGSWQLAPAEGTVAGDVDTDEVPPGEWANESAAETDGSGDGQDTPRDADPTRVTISVEYDPGSVTAGIIDLPRFVSLDRVVEKATPLVEREARTVLERLVAELEGEPRPIDLTVRHGRSC
jgi:uncharacterized membrane protein